MLETKPSCIRLERAVLCLDCETIGDDAKRCVQCLSIAVHPVASFLNRQTQEIHLSSIFWLDWFNSFGVPVAKII